MHIKLPLGFSPCSCVLSKNKIEIFLFTFRNIFLLDAVIVSFIFYDCWRSKIENPLEGVPDASGDGGVAGGPVPDAEDVLLEPDGDHGPADLLPDHELFTQHGKNKVLPTSRCKT